MKPSTSRELSLETRSKRKREKTYSLPFWQRPRYAFPELAWSQTTATVTVNATSVSAAVPSEVMARHVCL